MKPCRWCNEERPLFDTFSARVVGNGKPFDVYADGTCLKCATTQVINAALDAWNRLTKEALTKV